MLKNKTHYLPSLLTFMKSLLNNQQVNLAIYKYIYYSKHLSDKPLLSSPYLPRILLP